MRLDRIERVELVDGAADVAGRLPRPDRRRQPSSPVRVNVTESQLGSELGSTLME
jgi:hypothetical protein